MKVSDSVGSAEPHRLTTKGYWDRGWERAREGRARLRRIRKLESLDRQMARLLVDCVARAQPAEPPARVLEVGCANSIWLPYLGRETGCRVFGVDFSERGCHLAEQNLAAMGVAGTIACQDFFEFKRDASPTFDVVLSFGVIEHFPDVAAVLSTMVELLRPGGVLFASVPNLAGVYGPLQRVIDERVYRRHVILKPDVLTEHARRAGLVGVESGYVGGPLRLSALNLGHLTWLPAPVSRFVAWGFCEVDCLVAAGRRAAGGHSARPSTAPYVYVSGAKPEAAFL